ncbi:MAG: DEAD/DEAH box helicase, partial [Burkholderiaceae bacterium]|nr:DEAD/DEAH box helicase [Burkholderiaceae bacterium]
SILLGRYELPRRSEEAHVYRLQHPLAQSLIDLAKRAQTASARVLLDYAAYGAKVTVLEALRGKFGQCAVQCLRVESLGTSEEYLLVAATCDGQVLDADVAERLLAIPGDVEHAAAFANPLSATVTAELARQRAVALAGLEQRNLKLFSAETDKLDAWADDQRAGLEQQIKELDRQIKETRTKGKGAATLAEKLEAQRRQRELEALRDRRRRDLFARQDEIQKRRDQIVDELEVQLQQAISVVEIVALEWRLL